METTRDITIYYVGDTPDDAIEGLPFDSYESAMSYSLDEGGNVYIAKGWVEVDSLTLA